jgi:hypothetical protein
MSYYDFLQNFEKMEICNLGPEVMDEITQMTGVDVQKHASTDRWITYSQDGRWTSGHTAGGCRNYIGSEYRLSNI